jgi:error-prone DNA polymerase
LCLTLRRRPGEAARLHALDAMARRFGVRALATGDVLYHSPDSACCRTWSPRSATSARSTNWASGASASPTAASRARRRWSGCSATIPSDPRERRHRRALHLLLRELSYQYPDEVVMTARSPAGGAGEAVLGGAAEGAAVVKARMEEYEKLLRHELSLVERLNYAPYSSP